MVKWRDLELDGSRERETNTNAIAIWESIRATDDGDRGIEKKRQLKLTGQPAGSEPTTTN
jgi:hypothetical protein